MVNNYFHNDEIFDYSVELLNEDVERGELRKYSQKDIDDAFMLMDK